MCQDEEGSEKRTANVVDIRAKNSASQKIAASERIAHEIELNRLSQTAFLDAWKDGIALIGETHFVITSSSVAKANEGVRVINGKHVRLSLVAEVVDPGSDPLRSHASVNFPAHTGELPPDMATPKPRNRKRSKRW